MESWKNSTNPKEGGKRGGNGNKEDVRKIENK